MNGLVSGGDGASIEDFYLAMEDAGVAPSYTADLPALLSSEPALDVAAASDPIVLGVTVAGLAGYYGVRYLWGTFSTSNPSAHLDCGAPVWTWISGAGHYELQWGASSFVSHAGSCLWDNGEDYGVPDPSTLNPATQQGVDAQAIWNAESADCGSTGSWVATDHGHNEHECVMTQEQYTTALQAVLDGLVVAPGSPEITTTITAPSPAQIDWSQVRSDISTDTSLGSYVDTQLAQATVDYGQWIYDGASVVTYGPFTVPEGVDTAAIECFDDNSSLGAESVTPGATVTLQRTGIGFASGDGPAFFCYLDFNPNTETQSATQAANDAAPVPEYAPEPASFEYGTAAPPTTDNGGGGGGTTFDCPTVDIGTIDFTPLEGLSFGTKFPFGALTWAKNGVTGWDGSQSAPTFDVPQLGAGQGHPVVVDLGILDGLMVTFREFVLIACTFGLIWFLATSAFGFKDWGVGEQGTLF